VPLRLTGAIREVGQGRRLLSEVHLEAVSLSDRVLVMSPLPGRLIEEIVIELPRREDPLWRREQPRMAHYVPLLMSLLHLRDAA